MKKFLKNFDRFSKGFFLTYKGKKNLETELGGSLTILAMIIILFNGFLIGKDIYYKENPTVLTIEKNLDFSTATRINYKNMFFGYALSNGTIFYEDNSVISVVPYILMFYYNKNHTLKNKRIILEVNDCQSEFEKLDISPPFIPSYFEKIKCIKDLDVILSGSWKENPLQYLRFEVRSCKNESVLSNEDTFNEDEKEEFFQSLNNFTSSNQLQLKYFSLDSISKNIIKSTIYSNKNYSTPIVQCKSEEKIKEIISDLYFNFFYNKISFNSKSYSNPINSQGGTDWVKLANNLYKEAIFLFNHYVLSTDSGLIFRESSNEQVNIGYKQHSVDYASKKEENNILIKIHIYISNNVQYFNREYIKIQSIFANLGGIMKLIFFLFQIHYDPFLNKMLNLKIANKIFEFYEDNNQNSHNFSHSANLELKNSIINENKHINDIKNCKEYKEKSELNEYDLPDSRRKFNLNNVDGPKKKIEIQDYDDGKLPKFINRIEMTKNSNKAMNLTNSNLKVNTSQLEMNKNFFMEKKQKGKKLKFRNREILKYIYCRHFFNDHLLETKNKVLSRASEMLSDYTDFLNSIKLHSDITKLKYFIFNIHQLKCFEFIINPIKYGNGLISQHNNNELIQFYRKAKNKNEKIPEIIEYFKDKIKCNKLDEIDEKILEVIDPNLKFSFILIKINDEYFIFTRIILARP